MRVISLLVVLMASCFLWAQEDSVKMNEMTLDAQILTRGELRRGGLIATDDVQDADKANFVAERARLTFGFKRDALSMKVSVQHNGLWGMEGDGSNFDIYEAWAQLTAKNGLFAKVGRQELCYDDERILGSNDWAMAGLSHDVLKIGYEGYGHKVHAFAAYNQNSKNTNGGTFYTNGAQPYKSMQGLWYHYDVPRFPLGASLLFLNIGMESGTEKEHHTANQQLYGGYITFHPQRFSLELSYYRQAGKASMDYTSGKELPLKAWMGSVKTSFDINDMFTAYAGFDYISGDKEFAVPKPGLLGSGKGTAPLTAVRHTEITSFTSLYGSMRNFYGMMDFFYVSMYFCTFSPGLQNLFGGVKVKPLKGLSLDMSYHYMATATKLHDLNMTLGHMIELSAKYQVMRDVSVSAGYSYMSGTGTMERLERTTDSRKLHWGWVMLVISPQIFSQRSSQLK